MKTISLLITGTLLTTVCSAQKSRTTYQDDFPWDGKGGLTTELAEYADSIYSELPQEESIKFSMLSDEEEKLPEAERAKISYTRAEALIAHCLDSKYGQRTYYAEMVPFTMPHTIRSYDITSPSYKSFMSRNSQSYFVFVKPKAIATSKASLEFDASHEKEKEAFTLNPKETMEANLVSGTKITIPAGSLCYANGKPVKDEAVTLEVSEYKDLEVMVMKKMTTACGGRSLQTSGMWHIQAYAQGQPLQMMPNKHYDIDVEMMGEQKNMQVFTGHMKNGAIDWRLEKDGSVTTEVVTGAIAPDEKNKKDAIKDEKQLINREEIEYDAKDEAISEQNYINNVRNNNYNDNIYSKIALDNNTGVIQGSNRKVYDLKLNDFGWINCDAFDPESQVLVDVVVEGDVDEKTNAMLVYPKRKSVLPGYVCADGKSVKFQRVAADEEAILVIFKEDEKEGKIMIFTKVILPENDKNIRAKTVPGTEDDLRAQIHSRISDRI